MCTMHRSLVNHIFLTIGVVFLTAGVGLFQASTLFPEPAKAAEQTESEIPVVEILNPTPNAVLFQGRDVLYEAQITAGVSGHSYTVEWEPLWDGTTENFNPSSFTVVNAVAAFPANGLTYPNELRFTYTLPPALEGQQYFRVRVTDINNTLSTIATGRFFALGNLEFFGYTWSGASTVEGGNDAIGWTSFTCANQNLVCADPNLKAYGVRLTPSPGGAPLVSLADNAWLGETGADPGEPNPTALGWMALNRKFCTYAVPSPGDPVGEYCRDNADCPDGGSGAGTCTDVGTPPAGDMENWTNQTEEASYLYSSIYPWGGEFRYPSQIAGWARLLTLKQYGEEQFPPQNDWGWAHLRGPEAQPNNLANGYTNLITRGYQSCLDCSTNGSKCNICAEVQVDPFGVKNYSCASCYSCDGSGNCDVCERCDAYGVSYDSQRGELVGFAWAGEQSDGGLGWMQYDPIFGGVGILQAWLATRYGDIFVGGDITRTGPLPSPPGTYNATYVIQANGTIAFTSQAGYLQPNYPSQIELPGAGNQYINVLGRLDFNTMTQAGPHRYGETIVIPAGIGLDEYINTQIPGRVLDGKIYYYQGDAVIDSPVEFQPGAVGAQSGAGTFIIDGSLMISAPVTYNAQQAIGNIANLPSVAWLIRGDVQIGATVGSSGGDTEADVVGAFIAVGCPDDGVNPCGQAPPGDLVKQGVINTGSSTTLELIASGLMMARSFNFERLVISERGSEQVIYDGRLIANPPPGLQDLTSVLPTIREVTP